MAFESGEAGNAGGVSLLRLAIDRPVAVTMFTLAVVVFGSVAYSRLQVALMPRFSHPTLTVRAEYPGSAPEEVEQFVTIPLEEALSIVSGLLELRSVSRAGLAEVVMEFQWGTALGLATLEARERLDRLVLPEAVKKPILLRFDPDEEPILRMALTGPGSLASLRDLAEDEIKPRLQTTPGVAFVQVRGGAATEVIVELDEGRLAKLGLSVARVAQRLRAENINLAGGVLREGRTEYRVRTLNELASLDEMRQVLVSAAGAPPVRLEDIALVRLGEAPESVHARVDGRRAVEIEVFKEADANVVEVARRVNRLVWGAGGSGEGDGAARRQAGQAAEAFKAGEKREKDQRAGEPRDQGRRKERVENSGKGGGKDGRKSDRVERRRGARKRPLASQLEKGMTLRSISDRSRFIAQALGEVRKTALIGALLAMVVLFLFLGRLRPTLFVLLAVPLSVLAAFLCMFAAGLTLNMISLGGLALGVGMLVDNAIVVLEAIQRLRDEGLTPYRAAREGVGEVGGAVTASTLTTVAVFLPLVFVEGVAGQLFGDLALTVVFSLLASLLVALFLLPMLFVHLGAPVESRGRAASPFERLSAHTRREWHAWRGLGRAILPGLGPLLLVKLPYRLLRWMVALAGLLLALVFRVMVVALLLLWFGLARLGGSPLGMTAGWVMRRFAGGMEHFAAAYGRLLRGAVARPGRVLAFALALFAVSLWWSERLEQELIPPLHQGLLLLRVEAPPGSPLEVTSELVERIERAIPRRVPGATTFARIGEEPDAQSVERGGANIGLVWIRLAARDHLARAEARAMDEVREVLREFPDLTYRIRPPPLFSLKPPIAVEIQGTRLDALGEAAREVEQALRGLPELTDVNSARQVGSPEIQLLFNRELLARRGLTARGVAELVRDKLEGETSLQYRTLQKKVDVRVRVRRPQLDSLQDLAALTINPGAAVAVPLSAVAELREGRGPSEIRRVSQHRAAVVTAALADGNLQGALAAAERALAEIPLPAGVRLAFSGRGDEMNRSLRSHFFALSLAIFLVYLVMASQFESVVQPLVIMLSVPLAGIGVVWMLWAVGQTLDVLVGIGLIVLVGIVVNNAIVLVDYINTLRRRGMPREEAVITAGSVRLRPILMTTATTVLGLTPMALGLGDGAEIRTPMAIAVISGLISSTALTLIVIPSIYVLADRLKTKLLGVAQPGDSRATAPLPEPGADAVMP